VNRYLDWSQLQKQGKIQLTSNNLTPPINSNTICQVKDHNSFPTVRFTFKIKSKSEMTLKLYKTLFQFTLGPAVFGLLLVSSLLLATPVFSYTREAQDFLYEKPCVEISNLDSAFRPNKRMATVKASVLGTIIKPREAKLAVRLDRLHPYILEGGLYNSQWDGLYIAGGFALPWKFVLGNIVEKKPHITLLAGYKYDTPGPNISQKHLLPSQVHVIMGQIGWELVEWFYPHLGLLMYTHLEIEYLPQPVLGRSRLSPSLDAGIGLSF